MITVTHHKYLAGSPGELMAIDAIYETYKAGHITGLHIRPDNEVVVSYEDGKPAALITFVEYEETTEFWICIGYARPEYRRKGHYRACIEELKRIAAERGYSRIHTATHPDNLPAMESIIARGGTIQYVSFTFPV